MSEEGKLQRLSGTRKVYLQAANNTERQITDITDSFDPSNETLVIQLTALKNSYQEKFNKIKELDNEIINLLKPEESEKELEKIIPRKDQPRDKSRDASHTTFKNISEKILSKAS